MPLTVGDDVRRVTEWLEISMREWGIGLPTRVARLRLMPTDPDVPSAQGSPGVHWEQAERMLLGWAQEGRASVNLELRVRSSGKAVLLYAFREAESEPQPLPGGTSPTLIVSGPVFEGPRPEPPQRFATGDWVWVLPWLLAGTREGPFPIIEAPGDGTYVVAFSSQASYRADFTGPDLILHTAKIKAQLPKLLTAWHAKHEAVDDDLRRSLRRMSRTGEAR